MEMRRELVSESVLWVSDQEKQSGPGYSQKLKF